jgi:hypothetical protein
MAVPYKMSENMATAKAMVFNSCKGVKPCGCCNLPRMNAIARAACLLISSMLGKLVPFAPDGIAKMATDKKVDTLRYYELNHGVELQEC